MKVYGTEVWTLLYSGGVPDVMSVELARRLYLSPQYTSKRIMVANGESSSCVGSLLDEPTIFGEQAVKLDFLVVNKSPFDLIIGLQTLTAMCARIDFGAQSVLVNIGSEEVVLSLEPDTKASEYKLMDGDGAGYAK